ncbi:MAG: hypothetical protein AB1522_05860 [Chloroflexota bacterium]
MTHKLLLSNPPRPKPPAGKGIAGITAHFAEIPLSAENHLVSNVFSNVLYTFVAALVNLWLTPFLISTIGIAAFGMIPLTNSIVAYAAIFTTAIYNSVSRFLAIELENKNSQNANKVFNTAMFSLAGIIFVLVPAVVIVAIYFPTLFHVPVGWEVDSAWLFILTAATFFITLIGSVFSISPFLQSQFVPINTVNFVGLGVKFGLIVLVYSLLSKHLWYVGAASLVGAAVTLAGFVLLWQRFTPQLRLNLHDFEKSQLAAMGSMAGWVTVNMAGAMLLSRADLLIINNYFGAMITGGYASMVQLSMLLDYAVNAASIVLRPILLTQYAHRDYDGIQQTAYISMKILGLLMAVPVGLLCGFASPLIRFWLGEEYTFLAPILILVVFYQGLSLSARPLLFVQNAYDRVKWPGIITLISGVGAILLAIALCLWGRWGYAGVPLAIALVMILKNGLYMPLYTAHLLNRPGWVFLPAFLPGVIYSILVGAGAFLLDTYLPPQNWLGLAFYSLAITAFFAIAAWFTALKPTEKQFLKNNLHFGW